MFKNVKVKNMSIEKLYNTRNKKVILGIVAGIILTIPILTVISLYPFRDLENIIKNHKTSEAWTEMQEKYQPNDFILCKFSLTNPTFALIEGTNDRVDGFYSITLYNSTRDNMFSQKFNLKYNGGAQVSNTTFPDFLSLAKSDCSQFRTSYPTTYNPRKADDNTKTYWTYSPPPTKEEIQEQEENKKRIAEEKAQLLQEAKDGNYLMQKEYVEIYNNLTQEEKDLINNLHEQRIIKDDYDAALWMKENGKTNKNVDERYLMLKE